MRAEVPVGHGERFFQVVEEHGSSRGKTGQDAQPCRLVDDSVESFGRRDARHAAQSPNRRVR